MAPEVPQYAEWQRYRPGPNVAGIRVVNPAHPDVRIALVRQWELISDAIGHIDLSAMSRCTGWTNREVLAHLYVQPHLVARFLRTRNAGEATLGVGENLSGTGSFSTLIDASAREGAALNKVELRGPLEAVRPLVLVAALDATITTLQGSISVSDYLVTRCVEAVVHGGDLAPPVPPDPAAQAIASKALLDTLCISAPDLVGEAAGSRLNGGSMWPLEDPGPPAVLGRSCRSWRSRRASSPMTPGRTQLSSRFHSR